MKARMWMKQTKEEAGEEKEEKERKRREDFGNRKGKKIIMNAWWDHCDRLAERKKELRGNTHCPRALRMVRSTLHHPPPTRAPSRPPS